jgi:glutathione synthase/RimK-type ligase-like ATP-grasp enzyme
MDVAMLNLRELDYLAENSSIFTLHLALDQEINTHQKISAFAAKHNIKELNPYTKLASLADDKYLFFKLMQSNEIAQAKTELMKTDDLLVSVLEKFSMQEQIVIKPNHGTEKIDFRIFDKSCSQSELLAHVQKILEYDECLIQEYLDHKQEHRVIYLLGELYANKPISKSLQAYVHNLIDILKDFQSKDKTIEVFAFDILETHDGNFFVLETNIRPAGLHRAQQSMVSSFY